MLTIIIVAFGNNEDVIHQLRKIDHETLSNKVEVVVIDNNYHKSDLSYVVTKNIKVKYQHYQNIGFAAAVNMGILESNSKTTHTLLLNPDCDVSHLDIKSVCNYAALNDETIFAPLIFDENDEPIESFKGKWSVVSVLLYRSIPYRMAKNLFRRRYERLKRKRHKWLLGAFIIIPNSYFAKFGMLDPEYFLCADDMADLLIRNDGSFKIKVNQNHKVVHRGGGSSAYVRKSALAWAYYGHVYYFKKNSNYFVFKLVQFLLAFFLIPRLLYSFIKRDRSFEAFKFALNGIKLRKDLIRAATKSEFL